MSKEKFNCQQIVIAHKCGGSFTIQPESFVTNSEKDGLDSRYKPMCLNCFDPITPAMVSRIHTFCYEYQQIVKTLAENGLIMTIVEPEGQNSGGQKKATVRLGIK
jgi:hypothetical protein